MKSRTVIVAPQARGDLRALHDWIARAGGPKAADAFLIRLKLFLQGLSSASERGHLRNDIRAGLRIVGFERRLTIAFAVIGERVVVLRVFRSGRNWEGVLGG